LSRSDLLHFTVMTVPGNHGLLLPVHQLRRVTHDATTRLQELGCRGLVTVLFFVRLGDAGPR